MTLGHEVEDGAFLRREVESPGMRQLAAAVRRPRQPKVLQDLAQRVRGELTLAVGRMAKYFHQAIMEFTTGQSQIARRRRGERAERSRGGSMTRFSKRAMLALAGLLAVPALEPDANAQSTSRQDVPAWVQRGLPNEGSRRAGALDRHLAGAQERLRDHGTEPRPAADRLGRHHHHPRVGRRWPLHPGHDDRHGGGSTVLAPRLARLQQHGPALRVGHDRFPEYDDDDLPREAGLRREAAHRGERRVHGSGRGE